MKESVCIPMLCSLPSKCKYYVYCEKWIRFRIVCGTLLRQHQNEWCKNEWMKKMKKKKKKNNKHSHTILPMLCTDTNWMRAMKNGSKRIKTKAKIVATMSLVPYLFFLSPSSLALARYITSGAHPQTWAHSRCNHCVCVSNGIKGERKGEQVSNYMHIYSLNDCRISDLWTRTRKAYVFKLFFLILGAVDPNLNTYRMYTIDMSRSLSKAYWTVKRIWTKEQPQPHWCPFCYVKLILIRFWFRFRASKCDILSCVFLLLSACTPKLQNKYMNIERKKKLWQIDNIHPSIVIMVWIYVDIFSCNVSICEPRRPKMSFLSPLSIFFFFWHRFQNLFCLLFFHRFNALSEARQKTPNLSMRLYYVWYA